MTRLIKAQQATVKIQGHSNLLRKKKKTYTGKGVVCPLPRRGRYAFESWILLLCCPSVRPTKVSFYRDSCIQHITVGCPISCLRAWLVGSELTVICVIWGAISCRIGSEWGWIRDSPLQLAMR